VLPDTREENNMQAKEKKNKVGTHLSMNANYIAIIPNYNSSIPHSLAMVYIPLKYRAHNYHVIFLSKFLKELSRFSINWFSILTPSFLSSAEGKRHSPGFLNFRVQSIRDDVFFWNIIQCLNRSSYMIISQMGKRNCTCYSLVSTKY
jgi:hypothetical protein